MPLSEPRLLPSIRNLRGGFAPLVACEDRRPIRFADVLARWQGR